MRSLSSHSAESLKIDQHIMLRCKCCSLLFLLLDAYFGLLVPAGLATPRDGPVHNVIRHQEEGLQLGAAPP